MEELLSSVVIMFIIIFAIWELVSGRGKDGKRTKKDWQMAFLATFMMAIVQRPLLAIAISLVLSGLFPTSAGSLAWLQTDYFWWALISYFCIEEFLHGASHLFAHRKRPKNKILQWIQAFYKMSHRPHHLSGGTDNKGQVTVLQTFINGWAWWFILPNFWVHRGHKIYYRLYLSRRWHYQGNHQLLYRIGSQRGHRHHLPIPVRNILI
jgi:hypothetical protein